MALTDHNIQERSQFTLTCTKSSTHCQEQPCHPGPGHMRIPYPGHHREVCPGIAATSHNSTTHYIPPSFDRKAHNSSRTTFYNLTIHNIIYSPTHTLTSEPTVLEQSCHTQPSPSHTHTDKHITTGTTHTRKHAHYKYNLTVRQHRTQHNSPYIRIFTTYLHDILLRLNSTRNLPEQDEFQCSSIIHLQQ